MEEALFQKHGNKHFDNIKLLAFNDESWDAILIKEQKTAVVNQYLRFYFIYEINNRILLYLIKDFTLFIS